MTRNQFSDGDALIAPSLSGLSNAHEKEGVLNGVSPSKGAGNYDVDISSGEILVTGLTVDVAADTVTLTSPAGDADLDPGEFRVDTISVDNTGTVNVSEGTAAVEPIAPDIPTDEVLISLVVVDGSGSSLSSGDIRDRRTIIDRGTEVGWIEDPDSPFTVSGGTSVSGTLDNPERRALFVVYLEETSSNSGSWEMTVNGETTDYNFTDDTGTRTTAASSWLLGNTISNFSDVAGTVEVLSPNVDGIMAWTNLGNRDAETGMMLHGGLSAIYPTITSFEITHTTSTAFDAEVEVYTRP